MKFVLVLVFTLVSIESSSLPEGRRVSGHREAIGPPWGAVAVADHNVAPWEDLESDTGNATDVNAHESDLFEDKPPLGLEIHDYPHDNTSADNPVLLPSDGGLAETGNLNADCKGAGSKSVVSVKGSVHA